MNIAIFRIYISRLTKPSPSMILSYVSWILFPDIQISLKDVSGKNNSYKQRGQRQDDYKISTGEWSIHTFQYMKHSNHSWIFYCFFLNLLWILQKQALHSIADFNAYQTNCFMFDSGVLLRAVKNHWTVYEIDLFLFCDFNRMIWFVLIAVIRDQMFLL